jgi:transposase
MTPAQVVATYARRMQIEQSFRDLKSHRYGVGFEDSLTRKQDRLAALLLILALASFLAWITARAAANDVLEAARSALTRSHAATAVSWHRIGWRLLTDHRWRPDLPRASDTIYRAGDALASG